MNKVELPASAGSRPSWNIRSVLAWTENYLKSRGFASARLDTELLLSKVLGLRRIELYMYHDRPLSSSEQTAFGALLRRRLKQEPLAYICGEREFWGHSIQVSPAVLIPRPDSETLVEAVLAYMQARGDGGKRPLRLLDVGTGSGCLAISLALAVPQLEVEAWDISPAALELAAANAQRLGVASRLRFVQCDALDPVSWQRVSMPFDLLVSNPPYIAASEAQLLSAEVRDFEPALALFAAQEGLAFYYAMASLAKAVLSGQGRAFWEIGYTQGESVRAILAEQGWQAIAGMRDFGGHERVISASPHSQGGGDSNDEDGFS